MKIAFVINVFREDDFHSGGEKLFYELVRNAINEGHLVDLYCSKYLYNSPQPVLNINELIISGNSRDYKYPDKIEKLYEEFKKIIDTKNYDHIIAENITPPLGMVVLQGHSAKHYKKISTNILERLIYGIKKFKQLKYQEKWIKNGYRKIFVPSKVLKNELIQNFGVNENNFVIIYPGVEIPQNLEEINYSGLINGSKALNIGLSAPSFTKKGGYIFLKALKLLKKEGYKFKANIIYAKAQKNLLLQVYLKLNGLDKLVNFLPYQSDMSEFYNSIDCVVMPSLMETFGLVPLEAMARKKCAVVGSYSGISEVISDGNNGFVFEMESNASQNLAQKLKFLLDNPSKLQELTENAFNTAQKLSWESTCTEFMKNLI